MLQQQGNQQYGDSQQMECEVLTDSGQTVEDDSGYSNTEPKDPQCKVLTESGQTVEDSIGHSDIEATDGTV